MKQSERVTRLDFQLGRATKAQLEEIARQRDTTPSELMRLGVHMIFLQHNLCSDPKAFRYWLRIAELHDQYLMDLEEFGKERADQLAWGRSEGLVKEYPGYSVQLKPKQPQAAAQAAPAGQIEESAGSELGKLQELYQKVN